MNAFNRVVVVVLLLALLTGIIYVALQPTQAVQYTQTGVSSVGTFFNNAENARAGFLRADGFYWAWLPSCSFAGCCGRNSRRAGQDRQDPH